MPNQPKTPNRAVRVEDELWNDYGDACAAKGTNRSEDLRAHIVGEVEAWRGGQGDVGELAEK